MAWCEANDVHFLFGLATARSVRRPHQHAHPARQPVAPLPLLLRLHPALRTAKLGTAKTELANAQYGTIPAKLLKIGAKVRISVRRIWIAFSESYPFADLLRTVLANLQGAPRWAGAP
jgi:hypothetical protein